MGIKLGITAMGTWGYLVIAVLLFWISYFDDAVLAGIKWGVLWKTILLVFAFASAIVAARPLSVGFLIGLLIAIKYLIYVYTDFEYFLLDVIEAIKFLTLPVAIEFLRTRKRAYVFSRQVQVFIAYWVLLGILPFSFGLHSFEVKDFQSLSKYGMDDSFSYSGIFGNPHNAAVTISAAILIIFHCIRIGEFSKRIGVVLVTIGMGAIYYTYARTGWLALLVGIVSYVLISLRFHNSILLLSVISVLVLMLGYVAFESSELFRMRITGTNLYVQDDSLNQMGSGRLEFWQHAIDGPMSEGVLGILIGIGIGHAKDLMEYSVGMRIFSHNGFLDAYQTSGLIGLFLFCLYFFYLWTRLRAYSRGAENWMAISLFCLLISVLLIQGGTFFWLNILLAASYVRSEFWFQRIK